MVQAEAVVLGVGGLLAVAGIATVIFQMVRNPPPREHTLGTSFNHSGFEAKTAYPGIVMILVGAVLLIAGAYLG